MNEELSGPPRARDYRGRTVLIFPGKRIQILGFTGWEFSSFWGVVCHIDEELSP